MEVTIKELLQGYESTKFTPEEIVSTYLDKIQTLNAVSNSFIQITDALVKEELEKLDTKARKSLYGVPFSIKDCIDVKGYPTTNGVKQANASVAYNNALIVDLLEEAGAICLGKTNLTEYATSLLLHSQSFGKVINPYHPNIITGGSSSGSAVAVAQNLSVFSIGTDTSGSTRVPAACNEIVGFKFPYHERFLEGITKLSRSQDHVGILTKNIDDLQVVLESLDFVKQSHLSQPITIGIPKGYFDDFLDDSVAKAFQNVQQRLIFLGYELIEIDTSFLQNTLEVTRTIGTKEFGREHGSTLNHNQQLSQTIKETLDKSLQISEIQYQKALFTKQLMTNKFKQILMKVDLVLTPTLPVIPPTVNTISTVINGVEYPLEELLVRCTSPFNLMGFPALSVPSNVFHEGLNFSVQLISLEQNIDMLLGCAKRIFSQNYK